MSPAQLRAFRQWLLAALRQPISFGGDPVPFPDSNCYRAKRNQPRALYPLCVYEPISDLVQGSFGEQVNRVRQQVKRLTVAQNPTTPFTVTITPRSLGSVLSFSPIVVGPITPGADENATRTAILAALDAYTPPPGEEVPATFDYFEGTGITLTATQAATGFDLQITTTDLGAGELTQQVISDCLLRYVRDLRHVTVSVRLWNELSDTTPDPELEAYHWLARVVRYAFSYELRPILRAANCPIMRHSDIRDLTALEKRTSEWVTMANVDFVLSVSPFHVEQPGTIERVEVSGTLGAPGGGDLVIPTFTIPES